MTDAAPSSALAGLKPLADLREQAGEGARRAYATTGIDPQLVWTPSKAERAALDGRSAIRVRIEMRALEGRLSEPCIYVDWGDGFSEETRKALSAVERGVYVATAHSNAGACRRVRIDPTTSPGKFEVTTLQVEPATEASGMIRRLSPAHRLARRGLRRLPAPAQGMLRAARQAVTGGPSGSGGRPSGRRRLWRSLAGQLAGSGDIWREAYVRQFEVARLLRSPHFAAPPADPPARDPDGAKVIAFYLPQFHPAPQNDAWWGPGFTEWTNVSKATPQFRGHVQPKLPGELGFYDLRVPEVRWAQADLARRTGVDAFCFYFYWFGGERLLRGPLDGFAEDEQIDLPFCLCWANENWTRRWDGAENEVLIAQRHSPQDDVAAFDDIARYMRRPGYLRVDGRPLLVIYRPDILPDAPATVARWRGRARELGLGELHLLCTDAFGFTDYESFGFDGLVEFPPHGISLGEITDRVDLLNSHFQGRVYDYEAVVEAKVEDLRARQDPRHYPGVMPSWDNEARKPGAGHVFHNAAPEPYSRWVSAALETTRRLAPASDRLVFVNAWNEWGEGAYLEPDRWFGHGFAQATRAALEATALKITADHPLVLASHTRPRRCEAAAMLHLHYPDLIEVFAVRLRSVRPVLDVAITFSELWTERELERLASAFPEARLDPVPNIGRDVAPFLGALRRAKDAGYGLFCKLHSKRSLHTADGDLWREQLVGPLTAPAAAQAALEAFESRPQLGLLATDASRMRLGEPGVMFNNLAHVTALAGRLGFTFDDQTSFPAGTMFWGRIAAFERLMALGPGELTFEPELGRIDGTLAHALERSMAAIAVASGFDVDWTL